MLGPTCVTGHRRDRQTSPSLEEVLINAVERDYEVRFDADAVPEHQLGGTATVDENDPRVVYPFRVFDRLGREAAGRDEYTSTRLRPVQRTDECLDVRTPHCGVGRVSLGFRVDALR